MAARRRGGSAGRAGQLNESHSGLAVVAAILIGLHLGVTGVAAALFQRRRDPSRFDAVERST